MFERFFNYSNELLCIASLEGRFLHINDAFVETLGYDREHLLSRNFIEFVHPEDKEKTLNELRNIESGLETINFENRYINANGDAILLSWKSTLDPHSNKIIASARDITAERLAADKYSQLYKLVTDNIICARTNVKGVITEVNDMFCEISGYQREELIGKTHKVVNSGVHDKSFFASMWRTISKGEVWRGAITNRRKDGSLYIVESIITPVKNLNGKIESYLAIRQDITERIQYQESAQKHLAILNETGAIAKVGGWELDVETNQLFWTDETFKILGVEKVNGMQPVLDDGLQLFTDEHKPIIDRAVNMAINHGQPYALELQAQTPSGEVKWVYTTGKANYHNEKVKSLSGTIQDIHDKKIAEIKYKRERQKGIQNAKLAALGELAASVAHEINNPLGIISGYAELIRYHEKLDLEKLDAILTSCERISHIVTNLKRFARSDKTPAKSINDLSQIIAEAVSLTAPRAKRHLVNIINNSKGVVEIWGNKIELEQVIINLINNAIDATQKSSSRTIWLQTKIVGGKAHATIEDTGGGISDSLKLRIFEPFMTTKTENKGTGLGLSVVKGILEDHHADINIENTKSGAKFELIFEHYKAGDPNG